MTFGGFGANAAAREIRQAQERDKMSDKCPKCGEDLCPKCFQCLTEHNEDPVSNHPGTEGNPRYGKHVTPCEVPYLRQLAILRRQRDDLLGATRSVVYQLEKLATAVGWNMDEVLTQAKAAIAAVEKEQLK
jgi:hypothetical protein